MASDETSDAGGNHPGNEVSSDTEVSIMASATENAARADNSSPPWFPDATENARIAAFCRRVLSHLRQLSPYKRYLAKFLIEIAYLEVVLGIEPREE